MPKTGSRRNARQRAIRSYKRGREDLQFQGLIDTTPEVSFRPERVNPADQSDGPQVYRIKKLIMQAIAEGWQTTEEGKRKVVDKLTAAFDEQDVPLTTLITAARTLQQLDRDEWERRNPELAGKVKGGGVQVNTTQQVVTGDQMIKALQELEKFRGKPIMSRAMLQIEEDASAVLPEEIT